ncbi:MAG: hypothetical protein HY898_30165 [Deltaproteobacteria bacterium]|nr:hypothetical protein [Deltaproteobacteria bacterium]
MSRSVANSDSRAAFVATLAAGTMMAQLVAGKAARDALFLAAFGARGLPWVMTASAVIALLAVMVTGRLMVRFSPARVIPLAFQANAFLFVAEWLMLSRWSAATACLVYLQVVALGAILSSGFWSVVNERFNPHAARAMVSRIAVGGSLGGLVGGLVGWQLASAIGVPAVLLLLAVFASLAGVGVWRVARTASGAPSSPRQRVDDGRTRQHPRASDTTPSAFRILRTVPYLRNVAAVVLLGAAIQALLDYALGVQAGALYGKGPGLMTFFSLFYAGAGVVALAVQLTIGPRILARWGVALGAALLPLPVIVGAGVALLFPGVVAAAAARGVEAVARNSVYRASYELLYTPLAPDAKRLTKAWIDVGFDRVGTAIGSGLVLVALAATVEKSWIAIMALTMALAALCAYAALQLRNGYVRTLADGLRRGAVDLSSPELSDARTFDTLTATAATLDRHTLLREIERFHKAELAAAAATSQDSPAESEDVPSDLAGVVAALTSNRPERVRSALSRDWPFASVLIAPAIALLDNDDVAADAVRFLREQAPRSPGQLLDALLDASQPLAVRRRLPRVLKACASQRCADGLVLALAEERFEVRLACARALFDVTSRRHDLRIDAEAIHSRILSELKEASQHDPGTWLKLDDDDIPSDSEVSCRHHGDRRLEFVFRLLALVHDRDPVCLAWKALRTGDRALQGTALEYLENVLPRDVRDALLVHLDISVEPRRARLSPRDAVDELLRSRLSIELQLGQAKVAQ